MIYRNYVFTALCLICVMEKTLGQDLDPRAYAKIPVTMSVFGASLSIIAPTGQYFPDKLINLGVSRWSFKPELALSQPLGKRWLFDLYAGLWLFTNNNSYYPGSSVRSQEPMGSFQTHISC